MKTTIAPNIRSNPGESEELPAPVRDLAEGARIAIGAGSFDPMQGRKIGSEPYDDPTQGRKIGSDPYDDPTRAR